MKSIIRTASVLAVSLVPALAFAQAPFQNTNSFGFSSTFGSVMGACSGISCIALTILYLINSVLVPVLFAVAFVVFLYGVAKSYIFSHGEAAEIEKGHKLILWGIIGFAVMVSLWGLVNVVANTFGLTGAHAPLLPKSY